ncbi:MAG: tetratricopeptide repeat protein [Desertifilum sp. SIO1I2]|nr:tetratricopeptide repeat protein [Desertifilum sp. SIO1I2]
MNPKLPSSSVPEWQEQAQQYWDKGDYTQAASLYEQAIAQEPDNLAHYWHLGLLLVLQGQEAEAQATWFMAIAESAPEEIEAHTLQLVQVLHQEAERQAYQENYAVAWAIRQHIRELIPDNFNNLLLLVQLAVKLENYSGEDLETLGILEQLRSLPKIEVNSELLLHILGQVLDFAPLDPLSLELVEACLPFATSPQDYSNLLLVTALEANYALKLPKLAMRYAELSLKLDPDNPEVLTQLASFYQNAGEYEKGIATAKLCYERSQTLLEQIFANHLVMRGLMNAGGYWDEALEWLGKLENSLQAIVSEYPLNLISVQALRLINSAFFFPYLRDEAEGNRLLQNQLAQLFQDNVQTYAAEPTQRYAQRHQLWRSQRRENKRPLRLGYISHCFCQHSVGWLARWLLNHHDRDRVELYGYFISYKAIDDPIQEWYVNQFTEARKFKGETLLIAEQIFQDEIDILIELDSVTLDVTCEVMALKPAPIQVTWLGWDASGVPAIDYYIADPYVLPESASNYYREKIWRLPQTYVAVDGFEVAVPTWRREDFEIEEDAIVYFSAQRGYKRHRETTRLQLQILKQVPNSYFAVKGLADEASVKRFFLELAAEEDISPDRFRFLPGVPSEPIHRANLNIADVVLDTYPYNGATTTLETLWMGIPLVTRVGDEFSSRNSYTMLVNAGVTEGIAWTDEEYVEWGVRLGLDPSLRQLVTWKLLRSRQTAPLWNGKRFAREMESAYEQMWQRYCEG